MTVKLAGYEEHTAAAVANYWVTLGLQADNQDAQNADHGHRAAVTGGKQMDGFCNLLRWFLTENGMPDASIHTESKLAIPGYYRPTKMWDLIIVHQEHLVACCEFKSQRGPSFGNNFNNRTEEALGTAEDVLTAYREQAFGAGRPAPWLGWLMLLEDCERSRQPVAISEPHFEALGDFHETSYADRYGILLKKLVLEKKYDAAVLLLSSPEQESQVSYTEPVSALGMKGFLAALGGHVSGFLASI